MKALVIIFLYVLPTYAQSTSIDVWVKVPSGARVTAGTYYTSTSNDTKSSTKDKRFFSLAAGPDAYGSVDGFQEIRVVISRNGNVYELKHAIDVRHAKNGDRYELNLDDVKKFTPVGTLPTATNSNGSYSTTTQKGASSSPAPVDTPASIGTTATVNVKVPETAEIRIDGSIAQSKGTLRTFILNDLRPKQAALIAIDVEAVVDGKLLQRSQTIEVLAGEIHNLDFSDLSQPSAQPIRGTSIDDPDAFPLPFTPSKADSANLERLPLPANDLLMNKEKASDENTDPRFPLIVTAVPDSCAPFSFRFEKKNLLSVFSAPVDDETPVLILELLGPQAIACSNGSIAFSASRWINPKENAEEFLPGDNKVIFFHQGKVVHIETLTKRPDAIELQKSLEGAEIFRVQLKDGNGKRLGYTLDFSIDGKSHATGPRPRSSPNKFWLSTQEAP